MTREEILKVPKVACYCDVKRGWVHEAFMDGVDYAERKMKNKIDWKTGEPKEKGEYLVQLKNGAFDIEECSLYEGYTKIYSVWSRYKNASIVAWCKLSDVEPYKENNK